MKLAWAILLFWAFLPWTPSALAKVRAQDGILDLRGQNLDQPIRAEGTWDFYWNQLLTPQDLARGDLPKASMKVPAIWSQDPAKYATMGYATYRLKVLADPGKKLGLFLDASIWSAARIFIDGDEVATLGKVGTTAETSEGQVGTRTFAIQPKGDAFDLIIQVSNFEIFLCGITIAPQFGSLEAVTRDRNQKVALDVFIVGALIIMGVYHLCLFLLRREDPSTLCFASLVCFTALWHATSRNGLAMLFIPDLGFATRLRIYNIGWVIGVGSCIWYFHFIFRSTFSRLVCWLATAVSLAFVVTSLVTSPHIFVSMANIYHFTTLLFMSYLLVIVFRSWRRKEEDGRLMIIGLSILVVAAIHDILAIREIISSPMMVTALGLFGFIFFQSFFLARRFSKAFVTVRQSEQEIRSLSQDLKALNNNLERLVEEKTRDIRSIMEHIPLGILMIQQNQKVHKDHSRKVYEFFARDQLEKANAADLVFADSNLTADEKSQAISCVNASLGEDAMNFSINQHVLPSELVRTEAQDKSRILELTWEPIVTADNLVDKILVTMRDVSDLRRLQEHSQEQQKELEYIAEIMNIPPERFQHFLETTDELMEQSRALVATAPKEPSGKLLKLLFINMHTLKGAARSLYLKRLSQMFHSVEQVLAHAQGSHAPSLAEIKEAVESAQREVDHYKLMAQRRLGRNPEKSWMVEYAVPEMEALYQEVKSHLGGGSPVMEKLRRLFYGKIFKDARLVFDELFSTVPPLAKDLGKVAPYIALETHGIYLSRRAEIIFRKIFIHLIRNAMDHGIETPDERLKMGKDPTGTISVQMKRSGDQLELHCYDDGRGLNIRKIQSAAVQAGLLSPDATPDLPMLAHLIFHPGMSTAQELSDISGRGIGMNAVMAFIEQNEGTITVELDPRLHTAPDHAAFRVVIRLPFAYFEEAHLGLRAAG